MRKSRQFTFKKKIQKCAISDFFVIFAEDKYLLTRDIICIIFFKTPLQFIQNHFIRLVYFRIVQRGEINLRGIF